MFRSRGAHMRDIIDFLDKRGCVSNITDDELRRHAAISPLKVYVGFDPTADSLHLGNLVGIIILDWFQRFGHTPVVVLGGATGRIGDPSGKNAERPLFSDEVIERNMEGLRRQFKFYLEDPIILNNDEWMGGCQLIDFLRNVGKYFRIGPMLGKDSVRSRIQSESGLSYTEFSYQILQGYDFYHLHMHRGVTLQIGGHDQWGNIVTGIELARKCSGKRLYGLTHPMMLRHDGIKFGKSEEGAIWLDPKKISPYQFYQYLVRVADVEVIPLLRMITFIEQDEIEAFAQGFKSGSFIPHAAQRRLAEEVTEYVHGKEGLRVALRVTEALAPGSKAVLDLPVLEEIAKDMPNISLPLQRVLNQRYVDLGVASGLFTSKSEGMRVVKNGGAYLNNARIEDPLLQIDFKRVIGGKYLILGVGRKKKLLVKID